MRLAPLPADQWDDEVQYALKGMLPRDRQNPEGAGTALSTLVRHPDLTKAFLGFNVYLLFRSSLPARMREVAILRVAHRRACTYEWAHHVDLARPRASPTRTSTPSGAVNPATRSIAWFCARSTNWTRSPP